MCRLIMNGLLLKYAGIVVPFGGTEKEGNEYLGIAARGSIEEQIDEERCRVPWTELGSYILRKGSEEMDGLRDVLKEVVIEYRKRG